MPARRGKGRGRAAPRPGLGGWCGGPGVRVQSPSRVAGRRPLLWPRGPYADTGVAAFLQGRAQTARPVPGSAEDALRRPSLWRGSRTALLMRSPEDFGVCRFEGHGHEARGKVRSWKGSQQSASCASSSRTPLPAMALRESHCPSPRQRPSRRGALVSRPAPVRFSPGPPWTCTRWLFLPFCSPRDT